MQKPRGDRRPSKPKRAAKVRYEWRHADGSPLTDEDVRAYLARLPFLRDSRVVPRAPDDAPAPES